jgi:Tyrosine phosphatase family
MSPQPQSPGGTASTAPFSSRTSTQAVDWSRRSCSQTSVRRSELVLHWDGLYNVRDLGGHSTSLGSTRYGAVVRSEVLALLSEAGAPRCSSTASGGHQQLEIGASQRELDQPPDDRFVGDVERLVRPAHRPSPLFEASFGESGAISGLPGPSLTFELVQSDRPLAGEVLQQIYLYFPDSRAQAAAIARTALSRD